MTCSVGTTVVCVAAVGILCAAAPAWAGCGDGALGQPAGAGRDATLLPASYGPPTIVGLWSFTFTAGRQVVDFGYAQWHADGTEIINSGSHHPATGNFCLGVWRQTGPLSYHLNHWALGYSPTVPPPGSPIMPAVKVNAKEDVKLDPGGDSFSGTFTITPYDFRTGAAIPGAAVSGQVLAQRVIAY
jgi:hypothetical protein